MDTLRFDLKRMYWLATAVLLNLGLVGWRPGVAAAIGVAVAQLLHFAYRERNLRTLTVQVRALYLAVLVLGLWPPLAVVHLVQVVGVWTNVLFDYCGGARMLSLMPWNRRVPLSKRLVLRTFLSPPAAGSILERTQPPAATRTARVPVRRASASRGAATRPSSQP